VSLSRRTGPSLTALGGAKVILELDKPQGAEKKPDSTGFAGTGLSRIRKA
jgi:hypothetical protein